MPKEFRAVGLGMNEDETIVQPVSNHESQISAARKRKRELQTGTQSPACYSSPSLDSSASGSGRKKRRFREKLVGIASRAFPDQPPPLSETSSDEVLHSELISGDYVFGDSSSRSAHHVTSSQSKSILPDRDIKSTPLDKTSEKSTDDNIHIAHESTSDLCLMVPQSDPSRLSDHGTPLLGRARGQGPHPDDQRSLRNGSTVSTISSSPISVSKDGPTRPGDVLRSSSPNSKERPFKKPRSSLHYAEHVQSSGHSAELDATPHDLSESQAQREIPETPNEQDASIIYGDSQGHSQSRAQAVLSEAVSSGNQVAQDIIGPIPDVQVQVQVNVHKQDNPDTTQAPPQQSHQATEAGLPAVRMQQSPQFSYSNITPLFSTEPDTMDADDDTAMKIDESAVDQEYIEQVAARLSQAVTTARQSPQTDHTPEEPVKQQPTGIETGPGNDTAVTETKDALASVILKELEASPDLQASWLTTTMLNEEAQQRLRKGADVVAYLILKHRQNRERDATSQTDHASSLGASTQVVPNNEAISVRVMSNQRSDATTQTHPAPDVQAPTSVTRDATQADAGAQVSPTDHVQAQDREKLAKDDFTQRLTKNIYELIKPNYAFTNLPKDNFYMKQKSAGPTLAEIKARPTRKQMMHKPQSASRLGEHIFTQRMNNMMNGARRDIDPERKLKTLDELPKQVCDELGGVLGIESEGFDSVEQLLELPRDVFPTVYKGELVFADNSNRSARSRSNRNATKYRYGPAARDHP
ncbi:hypothetical protein MBLNU457_5762t1 [Dothideomycetes sp. NU457]